MWSRLTRPRKAGSWLAGPCTVLLLLSVGCSTHHPSLLERELDQLRAPNGLYMRPGLVNTLQPDLEASAFAYGVIGNAGRHPRSPWTDAQAREAAVTAIADNSVWGPWYVAVIDGATGFRDNAATSDVRKSLTSDGYFADRPASPPDVASQLAATAAALDVLGRQQAALDVTERAKAALDGAERARIARWLQPLPARAENPYQLCNALSSLTAVGSSPAPSAGAGMRAVLDRWWAAHNAPGRLTSVENFLDLRGYACAAQHLGLLDSVTSQAVRNTITPYLSGHPEPERAYQLAQAWMLAGGGAHALASLSDQMTALLQGPTGLVARAIQPVGTLANSLAAERVRQLAGIPTADSVLTRALASAKPAVVSSDPSGLNSLVLAGTLRIAGAPDRPFEDASVHQVLTNSPPVVDASNVGAWAQVQELLGGLGKRSALRGRVVSFSSWPVRSELDRYDAWLALGLDPRLLSGAARRAFAALLGETPQILADHVSELSMKEIHAAVMALVNNGLSSRVPWDAVQAGLLGLQGCGPLQTLYRPAPTATDCDLEASATALQLLHLPRGAR